MLDEPCEWPLVSIVTPSFNQAEFIEDTIRSVLEQNYPHLEYIVMDGGSSDGTIDILRKYERQIQWISEPDMGQANAVNKGFRRARGEILGWINSDDLYTPEAIRTAVMFLRHHPDVMMVHGNCKIINAEGRVMFVRKTANFGSDKLLGIDTIAQPTVFFRRQVLEVVGFLDESLCYVLDWEFWVRMAVQNVRMEHIPIGCVSFELKSLQTARGNS